MTGRKRWLPPIAAAVVLLIAGGAFVVTQVRGSSAAAAVLEPAAQTGEDPFTRSVAVGRVVEFPTKVVAVNTSTRQRLPTNAETHVLVASGNTPGLYGGTGDAHACDPEQLVTFLEANPAKRKAWAGALGISPAGVKAFVATLTPVVLTSDTVVTNHGFRDGAATSVQSVLQAGTAVMVDPTGTPRVKCNCGNPLGPPSATPLGTTSGTAWASYEQAAVVSVHPSRPSETLVVTDVRTGARAVVLVGVRTAPRWLALETDPGSTESVASRIMTSMDGRTWTPLGTLDGLRLTGIAWGQGGWTAIARTAEDESRIVRSTDLRTWTTVATVGDSLRSIEFGGGRWVAVGSDQAQDPKRITPVLYTSTDGASWTQVELPADGDAAPVDLSWLMEVDYGAGTWTAAGHRQVRVESTAVEGTYHSTLLTSTDGTSWAFKGGPPADRTVRLPRVALGWGGGEWILAAEPEREIPPSSSARVRASITIDPASTSPEPVSGTPFDDSPLDTLDHSDLGWLGASNGPDPASGKAAPDRGTATFWASEDGRAWRQAGAANAKVIDLAYVSPEAVRGTDWTATTAPMPSTTTSTTSTPTTTTPVSGPTTGELGGDYDTTYGSAGAVTVHVSGDNYTVSVTEPFTVEGADCKLPATTVLAVLSGTGPHLSGSHSRFDPEDCTYDSSTTTEADVNGDGSITLTSSTGPHVLTRTAPATAATPTLAGDYRVRYGTQGTATVRVSAGSATITVKRPFEIEGASCELAASTVIATLTGEGPHFTGSHSRFDPGDCTYDSATTLTADLNTDNTITISSSTGPHLFTKV